ncbi:MAG: hypothetical protein IJ412_06700 [Oscillospiraceae bacterium]|nr:hypothetical protein [Oscillospiraceae bacterium]
MNAPIVTTTHGRVKGERYGSVAVFRGSPNGAGLPEWKPFTEADHACMTYTNAASQTRTGDFDKELRALAVAAGPGARKK